MHHPTPLGVLVPTVVAATLAFGDDPARARTPCPGAGHPVHAVAAARTRTLCLLNVVRRHHHLPALRSQRRLAVAAIARARALVRWRTFTHGNWIRRLRAYVAGARHYMIGENIAWGAGRTSAPRAVMAMWMASPPHRHNILTRAFREVGVGVAASTPSGRPGATYVTDFGGRW